MNTQPLRILVVVSRPLAQLVPLEHGGQKFVAVKPVAPEPVEAVRDGLRRVFLDDKTPARVRYLPWARLQDLLEALAEPYDVVHFVGHGDKEGNLLLEGDDGSVDLVSPQRLAEAMQGANVRLVLLSACHSGAAGRALHKAGIPNVVMVDERYRMHAEVAAIFNRQFYARLARGKPPSEAYEAGVRAVRMDRHFGDEAPPPQNRQTGEIEPRYGERFDKIIADDRPLVEGIPTAGYEELYPSRPLCTVTREEIFVGREAKMIEVIRQMQTARVVTLTGPGGIGKTALARRVALWHAERHLFRDGVIEVNLENVHNEGGLLSQLAYALGVKPDPMRPWDTIRAALTGHWLVLLDGAENLTPQAVGCLSDQLLGRLEELQFLVTSHAPLHLVKYEQSIEVDELPVGYGERIGPAEEMFIAYTPQKRQAEIVLEHFNAVREICRELGGYPLGILLEAAQLSDERETPESLLKALRANMVEALSYAQAAGLPERHKNVGAAMKSSYDRLSAAARQLLAHIAVFPGGAGEEMLKDLEGLEEARWKETERELRELGLVRWEQDRYHMLPPIRAWAQTTLPADELNAYRLRAARWLAKQARMWDAMLTPGEERHAAAAEIAQEVGQKVEDVERVLTLAALASFDRERENLLAAVEWSYKAKDWPLVARLVESQHEWQDIRALWAERERNDLLAVEAAKQEGDKQQQGIARSGPNLGSLCPAGPLGRGHRATRKHWKSSAPWGPPRRGSDWKPGQPGQRLRPAGPLGRGQARALGDRHGEAQTLGNLGNVYQLQGRWEEAIANYEKALETFRALGDRHGEGKTLNNLGNVYRLQGRWEEAIANYEKAWKSSAPWATATARLRRWATWATSTASRAAGKRPSQTTRKHWKSSAPWATATARGSDAHQPGQRLRRPGPLGRGHRKLRESTGNLPRPGRPPRRGSDAHQPGQRLRRPGPLGRGHRLLRESLEICRALGDRHGEAQTLTNLGNVYRLQGRWEEAIANYEKALEIFRALGDRHGEGRRSTTWATSTPTRAAGKRPSQTTRKHWKSSAPWATATARLRRLATWATSTPTRAAGKRPSQTTRKPGNLPRPGRPPRRGQTLMGNLGNVYRLQGRWEEAIANYEKALEIFRALGDRHGEAPDAYATWATSTASRAAGKRPSQTTRKHWKPSAPWATATARPRPWVTWPMSMPSKASWKRPWKLPRRPSASLRNSKPTQTS
jgi:tetratricopeptide (TPR) repeat protein